MSEGLSPARDRTAPSPTVRRSTTGSVGLQLAGRYRLDSRSGRDGDATSWTGHDEQLDRPVLVRVVTGSRVEDAIDAARRAAGFEDPRLTRVLDVGTARATDGSVLGWVVDELPAGRTLRQLAQEGPMDPARARTVIGEAATALDRASEAGLHHRRLDPSCLFVSHGDDVTVAGLVVAAAAAGLPDVPADRADREDAIGLISLLYTALTGVWPGPRSDVAGGASRSGGAVLPPADLVDGVPNDLDTLISVTLGPFDDGPFSPGELAQQLAPWGHRPVATTGGSRATAPRRTARRSSAPEVAAGATTNAATGAAAGTTAAGTAAAPGTSAASVDLGPVLELGDTQLVPRWNGPPAATRADAPDHEGTATAPASIPASAATALPHRTASIPVVTPDPVAPHAVAPDAAATGATTPAAAASTGSAAPGAGAPEAPPAQRTTVIPVIGGGRRSPRSSAARPSTDPRPAAPRLAPPRAASAPAARAISSAALTPRDTGRTTPARAPAEPRAAATGLGADLSPFAHPEEPRVQRPLRPRVGLVVLGAFALLVVVGAVLAWQNVSQLRGVLGIAPSSTTQVLPTDGTVASTAPDPTAEPAPPAPVAVAPAVTGITALDPLGDGTENDELLPRAVDGDPATSWNSSTYNSATLGGLKPGVGVQLSLAPGSVVSGVDLVVAGSGGTVEVRSSTDGSFEASTVLATATVGDGAGGTVAIDLPEPTATEHLVLWFTTMPTTADGFVVELASVDLR